MLKTAVVSTLINKLPLFDVAVSSAPPNSVPSADSVTVVRDGGQQIQRRPLLTVRRMSGGGSHQPWMGYIGSNMMPISYYRDKVRIDIETTESTGGQIKVDILINKILSVFMDSIYDWTFPPPKGLGLYFPKWDVGADSVATDEVSGNSIYKNYIEVLAEYPILGAPVAEEFIITEIFVDVTIGIEGE